MIAATSAGFRVIGSKGLQGRAYRTLEEAVAALYAGAAMSCADGACGAPGPPTAPQTANLNDSEGPPRGDP